MKNTAHTINEMNLSHITGGSRLDDIRTDPVVTPSFERRTPEREAAEEARANAIYEASDPLTPQASVIIPGVPVSPNSITPCKQSMIDDIKNALN